MVGNIDKIPSNLEAEIGILGSIIRYPNTIIKTFDLIKKKDFYFSQNQIIYEALNDVFNENKVIELGLVVDNLRNKGKFDLIGGYDYLFNISNYTHSEEATDVFINSILDASLRRKAINELQKLVQEGFDNKTKTFDFINHIETTVLELSKQRNIENFRHIESVTKEVLEQVEANSKKTTNLMGLTTGFKLLDKNTLGFQNNQLIILAARPAMGKSAMALNLATNIALKNQNGKASVAVFSLEMAASQLVERMIASISKVELSNIKTGAMSQQEWIRFNSACNKLDNLNIFFDDSVDLTVSLIRAKCRKLKMDHGLDFVVVDYLQLIGSEGESRSSYEEVGAISRGLKLLAMELNVPVLALSQLSRAVEKRDDKKPNMSDLSASGRIEQDADIVMFLYRDDYYNKETSLRIGEADLIIGKNRSGSTHEGIPLFFAGQYSSFEDKDN